jgi:hypothetical protein
MIHRVSTSTWRPLEASSHRSLTAACEGNYLTAFQFLKLCADHCTRTETIGCFQVAAFVQRLRLPTTFWNEDMGPSFPRSDLLYTSAGSGKIVNESQTSAKGPDHGRIAHWLNGKPFAGEYSDPDQRCVKTPPMTCFLGVDLVRCKHESQMQS